MLTIARQDQEFVLFGYDVLSNLRVTSDDLSLGTQCGILLVFEVTKCSSKSKIA